MWYMFLLSSASQRSHDVPGERWIVPGDLPQTFVCDGIEDGYSVLCVLSGVLSFFLSVLCFLCVFFGVVVLCLCGV